MKIIAHSMSHGNKELFLCALPGGILEDEYRVKADIHAASNKEGYQREPTPTRFKEIGEYVAGENEVAQATGPVMSQSLVLNSRKALAPRPLSLDGLVELDLGDDYVLWEVDGQHRIGGIRDAIARQESIRERRFPVVLLNGFQRFDEPRGGIHVRHDVRLQPSLARGRRGDRPDAGHDGGAKRLGVASDLGIVDAQCVSV